MQIRKLALNGVAAIGLAALAVPALAGESTPAEIMATNQLNDQQIAMANGTIPENTTIGVSGKTNLDERSLPASGTVVNTSANTTSTATPNETQPMTLSENTAGATAPVGESIASTPLSQPANGIANPAQTFATASVVSSTGQTVGAVQKIMVSPEGKAQSVNVALLNSAGQSKTVTIAADSLTYDQSKNVLVAQMTNDQIMALPSEPQG